MTTMIDDEEREQIKKDFLEELMGTFTKKGRKATFRRELTDEENHIRLSLPIDLQNAYHKSRTEPYLSIQSWYGKKMRDVYKILQNNKCAFCFKEITENPELDHSHNTGMVRGIVHSGCNKLFGFIEEAAKRGERDTDEICAMAAAYIKR